MDEINILGKAGSSGDQHHRRVLGARTHAQLSGRLAQRGQAERGGKVREEPQEVLLLQVSKETQTLDLPQDECRATTAGRLGGEGVGLHPEAALATG